jgi:sugar (glycoside-pentoside-hexuronide) transporter
LNSALKKIEKVAYLSGGLGKDILYLFVSLFLLFYYTNILGISAAVAGVIMLVVRIFDACFDIWFGTTIDKVHSKWGKFRPFLLFGAVPYAVVTVIMFLGLDLTPTGKIVYAFCMYLFYSVLYSVVSIPHAALNSVLTDNIKERAQLSSLLVIGSTVGKLICSFVTPLVVPLFHTQRVGYMMSAVIFSIVSILAILFCFSNTKERTVAETPANSPAKKKSSMAESFRIMFKNTDFLLISLSYLLVQVCVGVNLTIGIYYFTYYVGNFSLYSPVNLCASIASLVFLAISSIIIVKIGKKRLFLVAAITMFVAKLCYYFVPSNNYALIIALFVIAQLATSSLIVSSWGVLPDTTDLTVKRDGAHIEGLMYSVFNFFQKVGSSLAAAVTGFILSAYGYQSGVAKQSASGVHGVLVGNSLAGCVIIIIPFILMLFFNVSKKLAKYSKSSDDEERA